MTALGAKPSGSSGRELSESGRPFWSAVSHTSCQRQPSNLTRNYLGRDLVNTPSAVSHSEAAKIVVGRSARNESQEPSRTRGDVPASSRRLQIPNNIYRCRGETGTKYVSARPPVGSGMA